jgi:putative secretion ATPase (PEP-CTERM system associated)
MYEGFYNLTAPPFRLSPDPRFFYASRGHTKAMSYLRYGLHQAEGFIVITGDVGTGKSTLVNALLAELDQTRVLPAQIVSTNIDADDAVRLIVSAYKLKPPATDKATLLRSFEAFLAEQHRAGRRVLLVVDEAQNLPLRTIEELRMLSNFNVDGRPLFQSFLLGQPQFKAVVANPNLEQLRQRVIASYHLEPMSADETRDYIEHRLNMVGWTGRPSFSEQAYALIHETMGGVPRRINTLCNRLLLYGALEKLNHFDRRVVETLISDLKGEVVESAAREQPAALQGAAAELNNGALTPETAERLDRLEALINQHEQTLRQLLSMATGYLSAAHTGQGGDETKQ